MLLIWVLCSVDAFNNKSVENIEGLFLGCDNLIKNNVKVKDKKILEILEHLNN